MRLKEWLDDPEHPGRRKALADHLGVSLSRISQVANDKPRVPPKFYWAIRDFTGGKVDLVDMVPDRRQRQTA